MKLTEHAYCLVNFTRAILVTWSNCQRWNLSVWRSDRHSGLYEFHSCALCQV